MLSLSSSERQEIEMGQLLGIEVAIHVQNSEIVHKFKLLSNYMLAAWEAID